MLGYSSVKRLGPRRKPVTAAKLVGGVVHMGTAEREQDPGEGHHWGHSAKEPTSPVLTQDQKPDGTERGQVGVTAPLTSSSSIITRRRATAEEEFARVPQWVPEDESWCGVTAWEPDHSPVTRTALGHQGGLWRGNKGLWLQKEKEPREGSGRSDRLHPSSQGQWPGVRGWAA